MLPGDPAPQPGYPDQASQRNMDTWKELRPETETSVPFVVRNPLQTAATVHLAARPNPWPGRLADQRPAGRPAAPARRRLRGPGRAAAGHGQAGDPCLIADLEASVQVDLQTQVIGGFRLLDWPPCCCMPAATRRTPRARSVSIRTRRGQASLCASASSWPTVRPAVARGSEVRGGKRAGHRPAAGAHRRPKRSAAGAQRSAALHDLGAAARRAVGVQVTLQDPLGAYVDQHSQRNLDTAEDLDPGQPGPAVLAFPCATRWTSR